MLAQLENEEKEIRQEREKSAALRRERNAVAIAEVVGRSPAKRLQAPSNFLSRVRDAERNRN